MTACLSFSPRPDGLCSGCRHTYGEHEDRVRGEGFVSTCMLSGLTQLLISAPTKAEMDVVLERFNQALAESQIIIDASEKLSAAMRAAKRAAPPPHRPRSWLMRWWLGLKDEP